ncbi:MAG TPA: FAD-binding protein [Acidimicrobiia bacterium]
MNVPADLETEIEGAPEGLHLSPRTIDDVSRILRLATDEEIAVRVWGGGTHQRYGMEPSPGIVMTMAHLNQVETWEPDDLTLVAGAGAGVAEIENLLSTRQQSALLPEMQGSGTLGGVLATGRSSLKRGRMLGTRERVLEVTAVTGDGRVVRSGGRVVKNVSGYDLHRAMVGAFGSLGVIVSVCLKLWPVPPDSATIRVADIGSALSTERPLAVLETRAGLDLFVWGTSSEVDAAVARSGGMAARGLHWPSDPVGEFRWSLRVPPASVAGAIEMVQPWDYLAVHGAGEIRLASNSVEGATEIRDWAESLGGALVLVDYPDADPPLDPWGRPPMTLAIQRRLVAEFDPARIINPNRLPGGL